MFIVQCSCLLQIVMKHVIPRTRCPSYSDQLPFLGLLSLSAPIDCVFNLSVITILKIFEGVIKIDRNELFEVNDSMQAH